LSINHRDVVRGFMLCTCMQHESAIWFAAVGLALWVWMFIFIISPHYYPLVHGSEKSHTKVTRPPPVLYCQHTSAPSITCQHNTICTPTYQQGMTGLCLNSVLHQVKLNSLGLTKSWVGQFKSQNVESDHVVFLTECKHAHHCTGPCN